MTTFSTTLNNAIERDSEKKKALSLKSKHEAWERKAKLKPYRTSDGKTIFYCKTKERGEERLREYDRKQKLYKNL